MEEEENGLWELELLGNLNAQTLLDTIVWMCGLHFALHSAVEHQNLLLTRLSCLNPLAHLHTFCTQKMHRKISREEILCAAYAQKLGFLVIKLIIC